MASIRMNPKPGVFYISDHKKIYARISQQVIHNYEEYCPAATPDDTNVTPPPGSGVGSKNIIVNSRLFGSIAFDNTLRESHVLVELFNSADGVDSGWGKPEVEAFLSGFPYNVTANLLVNGEVTSADPTGIIDTTSDIDID